MEHTLSNNQHGVIVGAMVTLEDAHAKHKEPRR
jgi:hypothetical protein